MPHVWCIKIKLKPNSLVAVRRWVAVLQRRQQEELDALRAEGIVLESVFLDRTSMGAYLLCYLRAASAEQAVEAMQHATRVIDAYHEQVKQDTWGWCTSLELLLDFDTTT
jgi:Family of unknown function (DUF6176)